MTNAPPLIPGNWHLASDSDCRNYPSRPWPAVGVVVWKGDQLLVVKRGKPPGAGCWGLVGGALELGETHFAAATREALEETGIAIKPFAIITAIDGITRDAKDEVEFHYSIVEVNADWVSGDMVAASDALEAHWMTMAQLRALNVWSEMRRVVELAWQQKLALAK